MDPNFSTPVKQVCGLIVSMLNVYRCLFVLQFMASLLPESLVAFLKKRPTTMFMLACGALIKSKESYSDLTDSAAS